MTYEEDEDLNEKAESMIRQGLALNNIRVVRTTRMQARPPRQTRQGRISKPGLVKIQVPTLEDKINILRNKRRLENSEPFKQVYLRSSKSHTDRLAETNFRTLLDIVDTRKEYRIAGNGRIMKKQEQATAAIAPV